MTIKNETTFESKCEILAQLWTDYKNDEEFSDFFEYNDLGLPLAFAIFSGIVKPTKQARNFINETFLLLLAGLSIEEDFGFDTLDGILYFDTE